MHQVVKDYLETYLGSSRGKLPDEFSSHLEICETCRVEVEQMRAQADLFASFRVPPETEPAAGFYARVLERIEAQRPVSAWSGFLESPFGRRLAFASLILAVLMGTYLVSTEPAPEFALRQPGVMVSQGQSTPVLGPDHQQDRDVVLVNLATYQEQ